MIPVGPGAGAGGVGVSATAASSVTSWVLAGPAHTWGGRREKGIRRGEG